VMFGRREEKWRDGSEEGHATCHFIVFTITWCRLVW
jgi:hypothetical protein